jgi:methylthioribose-1-phosphate isomerase
MPKKQSPLFVPVHWRGDHFLILDETQLPGQVAYLEVRNVEQAVSAVKEMKTRAFGQVLTLLYAAALLAQASAETEFLGFKKQMIELGERFRQARSTFDFGGLIHTLLKTLGMPPAGTGVGPWIAARTIGFAASIIDARTRRAVRAAELLPAPCRLLTHCNISGELVAVAERCATLGKEFAVIVTETRPYLQGARLTAWELSQAGVNVELIPDCASAQVMAKGEVNAVLVGADRCAQNGDIVNKVGTFPLALAARAYGIPFYALVQHPGSLASGNHVTIEERPVRELLTFQGSALAPDGIQGSYPAFDVTPAELIAGLVGFDDVLTPEEFRRKYQTVALASAEATEARRQFVLVYGVPRPDGYSHLSSVLRAELAQAILVPEMRPGLWGARVVAPQLLERHISTTLVSDNMMGIFFARGQIRRVLLFCSDLGKSGPAGIGGLLLTALLAHEHKVPMELLAADDSTRVPLDADVTTFLGQKICPEGVSAHPLTSDVVPWHFFHSR